MRQGNAGDPQVGPTDPLEVSDLPEPVELGSDCSIDPDDIPGRQYVLDLIEPGLCSLKLGSVTGLEQELEPPPEDFHFRDHADGDLILGQS
jgi:hypothetical protein